MKFENRQQNNAYLWDSLGRIGMSTGKEHEATIGGSGIILYLNLGGT